jgi:hypothetical protein
VEKRSNEYVDVAVLYLSLMLKGVEREDFTLRGWEMEEGKGF